jgi:hypothetical protein
MGLFEHYPADPQTVYASADAIQQSAGDFDHLSWGVATAHRHATQGVSGLLENPINLSDATIRRNLTAVLQQVVFAAGCTRSWGDAITTYNQGIDKLNQKYEAAKASHFGLHGPSLWDYVLHGKLDEYAKARRAYEADVAAADASMVSQLKAEKASTLDEPLEQAAKHVGTLLNQGPTNNTVLDLFSSGALPIAVLMVWPNMDFSSVDMKAVLARLKQLGRLDWLMPSRSESSEALKLRLDLLREDGVDPHDYADLLRQFLLVGACEKAGIDLDGWDIDNGAEAMLPYLIASYNYYGKLYLDNPNFQWAGMASMIGPTFGGGMLDLRVFKQIAGALTGPFDHIPSWARRLLLPEQLNAIQDIGNLSEDEFGFFEHSLLSMQKQIFTDQMPMHEAYLQSGMTGVKEMYDAGLIDSATYSAWRQIDTGDPTQVAQGNKQLLYREQHDIIGDDYDAMRNHNGAVGQAMTWMLGAVGAPGIPGAQTLGQYDPIVISGRVEQPLTPGIPFTPIHSHGAYVEVDAVTPFPASNISNFGTRWDLIENDTLPAYQDLVKNHPDQVRAILLHDAGARIQDERPLNNIDEIIARLTDFDLGLEVGVY